MGGEEKREKKTKSLLIRWPYSNLQDCQAVPTYFPKSRSPGYAHEGCTELVEHNSESNSMTRLQAQNPPWQEG
jgi:hypothetical protein